MAVREIKTLTCRDTSYRVLDRGEARCFRIMKAVPEEPVEVLAEFPYTYNREAVQARAIRVAELFRDEDAALERYAS